MAKPDPKHTLKYPRKRLLRGFLRLLARTLMPLLARVEITGKENFPQSGPLIVVANHTGIMEVVMMTIYTPWLVEFMGSMDIPHESFLNFFVEAYGIIPVQRGATSRRSMQTGLDVLNQGGILGVFPEGGIWEPGIRQARPGVAWLSYHGTAPTLPIGFGSSVGALNAMFRFKRPTLKMNIGTLMPAVELPANTSRKSGLQLSADHIMDAIWDLIPEEDRHTGVSFLEESFAFDFKLRTASGTEVDAPVDLATTHLFMLSKLIFRNTLFNNLRDNLHLPVQPLKLLHTHPSLDQLQTALQAIIAYLEDDNPYYFTYRYGQREGMDFHHGIYQFAAIVKFAQEHGHSLHAEIRHKYRNEGEPDFTIEHQPVETLKL